MKIHDQIFGLWIPVSNLALVTIWIPGHFLWNVSVFLVLGQQFVVGLRLKCWTSLQGLPQNHRGLTGPEMLCSKSIYFILDSCEKYNLQQFHQGQRQDGIWRRVFVMIALYFKQQGSPFHHVHYDASLIKMKQNYFEIRKIPKQDYFEIFYCIIMSIKNAEIKLLWRLYS